MCSYDCPAERARPLAPSDRATGAVDAEDAAHELPNLPLEEALQLVHLYLERSSSKAELAVGRWLVRYLSEARRACGTSPKGRSQFRELRSLLMSSKDHPRTGGQWSGARQHGSASRRAWRLPLRTQRA